MIWGVNKQLQPNPNTLSSLPDPNHNNFAVYKYEKCTKAQRLHNAKEWKRKGTCMNVAKYKKKKQTRALPSVSSNHQLKEG